LRNLLLMKEGNERGAGRGPVQNIFGDLNIRRCPKKDEGTEGESIPSLRRGMRAEARKEAGELSELCEDLFFILRDPRDNERAFSSTRREDSIWN